MGVEVCLGSLTVSFDACAQVRHKKYHNADYTVKIVVKRGLHMMTQACQIVEQFYITRIFDFPLKFASKTQLLSDTPKISNLCNPGFESILASAHLLSCEIALSDTLSERQVTFTQCMHSLHHMKEVSENIFDPLVAGAIYYLSAIACFAWPCVNDVLLMSSIDNVTSRIDKLDLDIAIAPRVTRQKIRTQALFQLESRTSQRCDKVISVKPCRGKKLTKTDEAAFSAAPVKSRIPLARRGCLVKTTNHVDPVARDILTERPSMSAIYAKSSALQCSENFKKHVESGLQSRFNTEDCLMKTNNSCCGESFTIS